jgi:hypothetical protein
MMIQLKDIPLIGNYELANETTNDIKYKTEILLDDYCIFTKNIENNYYDSLETDLSI